MNSRLFVILTSLAVGVIAAFTFSIQPQPISYADSIFDTCYDDDECTIDRLYEMSQNNSTQTVFLTIDELVDLYADADFYCHPAAHHLGEFLFGYVNRDLKRASVLSDHRCAAGIMHGLLENTIQIENMLDGKPIESVNIKEACEIVNDVLGNEAKKECIHGMGHSLVKIYNYNTTRALEKCNKFDDWNEVYMCNGGLFMENVGEYGESKDSDFDKYDLHYPCNKIDSTKDAEAAMLCYRYQANYFLIQTKYDLDKTFSLCKGIEDQMFIAVCFKGISAHMAKDYFNDLDKTQLLCLSMPVEYQNVCITGAIELLTRFVSDEKAGEFCQRFEGELHETCQSRMNSLLSSRF